MSLRPSPAVARGLGELAREAPLVLTVTGHCMPELPPGGRVLVAGQDRYWPGDVVAFQGRDGRLCTHRMVGWVLRRRRLRLLTRADAAANLDSSVPLRRVLGRVVGGECAPEVGRIPLRRRLWAVSRLLGPGCAWARRRLARPAALPRPLRP